MHPNDTLTVAPKVEGFQSVVDKFKRKKDEIQKKKELSAQREHEIEEEPHEEEKGEEEEVLVPKKEDDLPVLPEESKEQELVKQASPEKLVEEVEEAPIETVEEKAEQPLAEEEKVEEEEQPVSESKGYVDDRKELEGCEEALVAQNKSFKVTLKKGETYYYCTCGRSKNQPFCDGSHNEEGCTYKPLKFVFEGSDDNPDEEEKVSLCGCKHNKTEKGPFCDGSHKNVKAPEW